MHSSSWASRPAGVDVTAPALKRSSRSVPATAPYAAETTSTRTVLHRHGTAGRKRARVLASASTISGCCSGLGPRVACLITCHECPAPLRETPWRFGAGIASASSSGGLSRQMVHGAVGVDDDRRSAGGWGRGTRGPTSRRCGGRLRPPTAAAITDAGQRAPDPAVLKVSELQAALRALGLPVSGRKAELVVRLLAAQGVASAEPATAAAAQADAPPEAAASDTPRRTRARVPQRSTGGDPDEIDEEGSGSRVDTDAADDAAATPGDGAVAARRRGTAARREVTTQLPDTVSAATAVAGAEAEDASLDDLFAAVKLDISVSTGEARKIQQQNGKVVSDASSKGSLARAAADSSASDALTAVKEDKAEAEADGQVPRRRRGALPNSGSDLDSLAGKGDPAAASQGDGASELRRRRAGQLPTEGAEEEATAAPGRKASRREVREGTKAATEAAGGAREPVTPPGSPTASQNSDPELGHEYDLPPWPPMFMGEMRTLEELAPGNADAQEELLLGNVPGMSLTVLGSAAVRATAARAFASLAMARVKDIFIFDAGDDTQRQVAQAYHVKPSKIFRIFLTSLEPESVLGLPGLMCVINASRERGHEVADIPVHVYGPPGTADFLAAMMRVSQTCLDVTIVVHEISTGPVAPAESEPYLYVKRARIWRTVMPPDQLNPRGGVDASLLLFAPDQGRSQKKRGRNSSGGVLSFDPRAGFLPFAPLTPGNPYRRDVDPRVMSWTLELDVTARVIINQLPGVRGRVLSYTVVEADRAGAMVVERATAAGLVGGRDFAKLKAGETVMNSWGLPVPPSLVISPTRPGRRMAVLGNTTDPSVLTPEVHPHMAAADVLVAGAVWPKDEADRAATDGGCTADVLGEAAARLGVRYVLLGRFDGQQLDDQDGYAQGVAAQVASAAAAAAFASASAASAASRRRESTRARCGPRSPAEWRRRVVALVDLDSVIVDKNEGPQERDLQAFPAAPA